MRQDGGYTEIVNAIEKLSSRHELHIKIYDPKKGKDNERRQS